MDKNKEENKAGVIKIVVLDKGFVFVGRVSFGAFLKIEDAHCIRHWGTSRGLGELIPGPTHKTKMDFAGTVTAPLRAIVFLLDVQEEAWAQILAAR